LEVRAEVVDLLSQSSKRSAADVLATSIILAHDEKNVAAVFDVIQPIAEELAQHGRPPGRALETGFSGAAFTPGSKKAIQRMLKRWKIITLN
jgi:hypothetical protein